MTDNSRQGNGKRVLCSYGIDLDAVSIWRVLRAGSAAFLTSGVSNRANTCNGTPANPTDVSRGIYGATVGVDRLLPLFDRNNIPATWFVPAHTLESFPKQAAKVRDSGHEIGLHGYTHERVGELPEAQERAVMAHSFDILTSFTGKAPRGWTGPSWSTSPTTVKLLEEYGIQYDHSFMHHDSQMYYLPYTPSVTETDVSTAAVNWMKPMSTIRPSTIVEIPANWHLDDWPALNVGRGGNGFVDPDALERLWKSQFDFYYREYDSFVFPITIHPQVSGKAHALTMHERLISYINQHEGVEWCKMEDMASEFKSGRFPGHEVEGGVD